MKTMLEPVSALSNREERPMDWVMMEKDMLGDESGGGNIHKDGDSENDEGGLLKDD